MRLRIAALLLLLLTAAPAAHAASGSSATSTPPAPRTQPPAEAAAKSAGCLTCHTATDDATMHVNPVVVLGCTDCHGGNAQVVDKRQAHVLPKYPKQWNWPSSANP